MEDRRLPITVGQGAGARVVTLDLPPFTLVGATTRAGLLTTPLRDRFGIQARLEPYAVDELASDRAPLGRDPRDRARRGRRAARSPRAAAGTPRVANRLLKRVRDFAEVRMEGVVTARGGATRRSSCSRSTSSASTASTARSCDAICVEVRRRPGRALDAGGRGRRGAGHDRGRLRALPAAGGPDQAHAARARGDGRGVRAPRPRAAGAGRTGAVLSAAAHRRRTARPSGSRALRSL